MFLLKQKTAYEMRISDWSSDVCSSDLPEATRQPVDIVAQRAGGGAEARIGHHQRPRRVIGETDAEQGAPGVAADLRARDDRGDLVREHGGGQLMRDQETAAFDRECGVDRQQSARRIETAHRRFLVGALGDRDSSEESRVGEECGSQWRSRWSTYH